MLVECLLERRDACRLGSQASVIDDRKAIQCFGAKNEFDSAGQVNRVYAMDARDARRKVSARNGPSQHGPNVDLQGLRGFFGNANLWTLVPFLLGPPLARHYLHWARRRPG